MFIGRFEIFPVGESSREHEDGRFRRMEIGDEAVDDLEIEARINKDIVLTEGFASFGPEFERASDSGADGDDAMTGGLSFLDGFEGTIGYMKPFRMHVVIFDIIAADG